jgi:uncharacterized protein (DUF1330 family)
MLDADVVEVAVAGGGRLLVRVEQVETGSGPSDIALRDVLSFSTVSSAIRGVATDVRDAIKAVRPDVAEVEFGLELALKGSALACMLVGGGAVGSIRVRLQWGKDDEKASESAGE